MSGEKFNEYRTTPQSHAEWFPSSLAWEFLEVVACIYDTFDNFGSENDPQNTWRWVVGGVFINISYPNIIQTMR